MQGGVNVGQVWDVGVVQLFQHALADHAGDHIIRGNDDVKAGAVVLQHAVHGLIAVVGVVDHLNTGLRLKVRKNGFVDIDAPVKDVYHLGIGGGASARAAGQGQAGQQNHGRKKSKHSFQGLPNLLS
ncbi:hypothetical protein SDC9_180625 [bioreactor metagenome]|uniref:Uncharacterized protein n=1 Tax=bioreactor metagenome TaxID=1076179 RepID=A0A645H486_9ZZZZ